MIKVKTLPAVEPVAGSDVRDYLRMDSTAYDTVLDDYAAAARMAAEKWTRRSFITTTWDLMLDAAQVTDAIVLPRPPLQSVLSVTAYNDIGTARVIDPTWYLYDNFSEPGWLTLKLGYNWGYCRWYNGFLIEYKTGYGDSADDVPIDIKLAITETAAWWYNSGEITDVPQKVKERLQPYRVLWF